MLNRRGVTLVELVTVMAIVAVASGLLYTVFFMNWQAFDQNIVQADLGSEVEQVVESVVNDSRLARQINVVVTDSIKQVALIDPDGVTIGLYTMKNNGDLTLTRDSLAERILTTKLDFANSTFIKSGNALQMKLAFSDRVFGRSVNLNSAVEVYPRN